MIIRIDISTILPVMGQMRRFPNSWNSGGDAPAGGTEKANPGVDLTQVIGLNVLSVLGIVSEIGVDMSKWRSAKAFSAWLGLCPRNKISGRKVLDTRTCKVISRVATTCNAPHCIVGLVSKYFVGKEGV